VYVTVYEKEELLYHNLVHVFSGKITGGELQPENELGWAFWSSLPTAAHLREAPYFPGFAELVNLLQAPSSERFFAEYVFYR
jgi:hypothetical protein